MRTLLLCALLLFAGGARAAEPVAGDCTLRDFRFHTGDTMQALRLHYRTLGTPSGEAVLVLHGTGQSGAAMLSPGFGGALFGTGQVLDAASHFIILPDAIGVGGSTKPSDGLRARFPAYDYADMVEGQYRLVTECLGLHHLRLVIGNSMGGMQSWLWAEQHPDFADGFVPLASQPSPMASRNWMMRALLVDTIRRDPAYQGGNYTTQPLSLQTANAMFVVATSGGMLGWQAQAPTAARADAIVAKLLDTPVPLDANDFLYQWASSHDYDASALERIRAPVLAINSADDERNPPQTGLMEAAMTRLGPLGHYVLIPASAETRGHGTTGTEAALWAGSLRDFLASLPH